LIYPEGDAIKERITNRYSLVVLAAKRARQLKEGAPALIETTSANALTVALEEIAAGKIDFIEGVEIRRDDESANRDNVDPAAALEDNFLSPTESKSTATPISQELAAFMEATDSDEAGEDSEADIDSDADDGETSEPIENTEA
jgi:DNA-directed RNA polymerase subunit omega